MNLTVVTKMSVKSISSKTNTTQYVRNWPAANSLCLYTGTIHKIARRTISH